MPDGDGYDLVRRVRELPPGDGGWNPAIAMSCLHSKEQALTAGFQLFVAKPFDLWTLIDTIAEFTNKDVP